MQIDRHTHTAMQTEHTHIPHYTFPRYQLDLITVTFTLMVSGVICTAWHYPQLVYCSVQYRLI